MKVTRYGTIAGILAFILLGAINFNFKFSIMFFSSLLIFTQICYKCNETFNMVSFMAVFPIIVLNFSDCNEAYNIILAFSIFAAISRLGCLFAGCCTGKETKSLFSLKYEGDYVINRNTNKKVVRVKPTIILELLLQLLIAYIVMNSKNSLFYFGILNGLLLLGSDFWRHGGRALDKNIVKISTLSLILFSIISVFKCEKIIKPEFKLHLNIFKIATSIFIAIIASNDINTKKIKKKI